MAYFLILDLNFCHYGKHKILYFVIFKIYEISIQNLFLLVYVRARKDRT